MGYVQQIGTPLELYDTPANIFVASFIGLPPMNFFDAEVRGDRLLLDKGEDVELTAEEAQLLRSYEGKKITLGVRPENVVLGDDITLKVNNCENLGQSTLVHGSINGKKVTAKLRQWSSYKYGEEIRVAFNRKHFFDKETTNAIR
jgi:multiple sugar transport system ATP-binding protein